MRVVMGMIIAFSWGKPPFVKKIARASASDMNAQRPLKSGYLGVLLWSLERLGRTLNFNLVTSPYGEDRLSHFRQVTYLVDASFERVL